MDPGRSHSIGAGHLPPDSVTESFLHVGNVVMRREDTSRARVQVVEPLVGDLSVAQVPNPDDLLPRTLGEADA